MNEVAALLEGTALAQYLKVSRWVYPFINAGHILGIALLVGAVLPMDVAILRRRFPSAALKTWAIAGFTLAVTCGVLLFVTQATDYVKSPWFLTKMALLFAALLNAALHLRRATPVAAAISLVLWPVILLFGRMIGYS